MTPLRFILTKKFPTMISPEFVHSSSALVEFLSDNDVATFSDGKWQSQSQGADQAVVATLTVFSQALTFSQLNAVVVALSEYVEFSEFSLHKFNQKWGDVVVVAGLTRVNRESDLNDVLGALAKQYCLEVAIHSEAPTLAEPGLLIMDMDSTVIQIECIDEIAKLAGVGEQVAEVTAQAMQGALPFSESLLTRVACLAGVEVSKLAQIRDAIPLMPGVAILVDELKRHNWKLGIASGGFTYFADHVQSRLSLDVAVSNQLDIEDGVLTGKVNGRIIDAHVKAETVKQLATQWSIPMSQTMAMGDGANDLVMMDVAALGVAFHAKPIVSAKADVAVRNGGLYRALYFLL